MKKPNKWLRFGVFGLALAVAPFVAAQTVLTFADLPNSYFFNDSGQNIGAYYAGYTFGPNVTALSVSRFGGYNSAAYPPHAGEVAIWDPNDPVITIAFATPVQSVGVWYASLGTITLQAYDQNNAPTGSSSGNPNTDGVSGIASFLSVSGTAISSVRISGVPGTFVLSSLTLNGTEPGNHQGLWWAAPAGFEAGWGINFAHQGNIIFATWFTFGADNQPQWYVIRLDKTATNVYSGAVSSFTGLPFNTVPYTPNANVKTVVGTATVTFAEDGKSATFTYTVNGITQTKQIVPQVFTPPAPTCVWGAQPDLTLATNYQDLWWVTGGQESGWGINFTHQGKTIFATWFTYDASGKAWWPFVVAAETAVPKVYSGPLKVATGPSFDAVPFDPNAVVRTTVGSATITIIDGNRSKFDYTVNGVTQSKNLARQVFVSPGTVCN